jgi:hypothetical protein
MNKVRGRSKTKGPPIRHVGIPDKVISGGVYWPLLEELEAFGLSEDLNVLYIRGDYRSFVPIVGNVVAEAAVHFQELNDLLGICAAEVGLVRLGMGKPEDVEVELNRGVFV